MRTGSLYGGTSWRRFIANRQRRTTVAAVLAVSVGVGVPGLTVLAGYSLGVLNPLRNLDNPVAAAAAARKATTATAAAQIPALTDLTAAVTRGPSGWAGDGAVTSGASLPSLVSCVPSPITPVVTVSRGFTVASSQVSVTLAAYVAGAGGPIFNSQFAGIPACSAGGASSTVTAGPADGPGVSSFVASTYQGGALTTTEIWRRGDVIAFLSGADPDTTAGLASSMDQTLAKALGNDCADEMSLATDNVRDPFAVTMRSDFKGLTVDQGIDQSPVPLPSPTVLPAADFPAASPSPTVSGSAAPPAAPSPSPAAFVQVVTGPLGTPLPVPSVAVTPSKPPWPVYPPVPSYTPAPIPPSVPASGPPTHAPLRESQVDTVGPGCGWAFTGMLAPTPPTVLTAAQLAAKQAALQPLLAREQAAWQASVNAYWVAYTFYIGQAQAYAAYTNQVNQVSAAWSVIDGNWQTYFTLKQAYDQMITDHNTFLKAQAAAQAAYAANQATCTPGAVAPAPTPAAPVAPATPAPGAATAAPADRSGPADGSAAPADRSAAHARAAATDSASPSASPTGGGGVILPTAPGAPTTSSSPSASPSAVDTATSEAPASDAPTAVATTAGPAPVITGTPCEAPPAILSQTPPALPTGPPPTKPADPRPKPSPSASASSSPSPTRR